ncbi:hypothetical protein NQ317_006360 [Molorchus minor]|uniref:Glucosylceramidase n=1 Tax=Molorchus minor TaxID=1323400 RepID=A0ABQ9JP68_9CUCU|nr:hypothetical protein NQ317_006360 [Molorchus minor]
MVRVKFIGHTVVVEVVTFCIENGSVTAKGICNIELEKQMRLFIEMVVSLKRMIVRIIFLIAFVHIIRSDDCIARTYTTGTVCVCNSSYCDTIPDLNVSVGTFQIYSTSKSRLGFYSDTGSFENESLEDIITITINRTNQYQSIIGFGGAFTDAAGINIKSLSAEAQEKLLEIYVRVPIGGTDFSTRGYSYADQENDTVLEYFELQPEDINYKIPFIQQAKNLTDNTLKLLASPWSAPKWMKTNNDWAGVGFLKDEYYQLWADYFLKFFDEYEKYNITYWGMTLQNEPINGFVSDLLSQINSMGWLPSQMNQWIAENLGPTIRNSSHEAIKIMLFDDNREALFLLPEQLENNTTMTYADGFAVHWYWNNMTSFCCRQKRVMVIKAMKVPWKRVVGRGGVKYILDIIENLEYGTSGWLDWNMVLDETGGPTYIDNNVDSPIISNETLQEFYKQPMFYGIGHFSKFLRPGSVRLETIVSNEDTLKTTGFLRPDNLTALIIFNSADENVTIQIEDTIIISIYIVKFLEHVPGHHAKMLDSAVTSLSLRISEKSLEYADAWLRGTR